MKKTIAIVVELIPIVSAVVAFVLIAAPHDTAVTRHLVALGFIFAFFGFVAALIGRSLCKGDKTVKILSIFDWLATLSVWITYILAAVAFGM